MDRPIIYSTELVRSFDILSSYTDILKALARVALDIMGESTTIIGGLYPTASSPASLTVNYAGGSIYQLAAIDTVQYGSLPSNSTQIFQQGISTGGSVVFVTTALAAGQSQWALAQVEFAQVDVVRDNDPSSGILPYFNSANPSQSFQGPLNSSGVQSTMRSGAVSVQVVYGTPATTGAEVPPMPTSGWVPLFMVDLAYGQTAISQAQIITCGPNAGLNVPAAYPPTPRRSCAPMKITATKTAAYTITAFDGTILGDATGAAFNITLPSAVTFADKSFTIKKIDASANAVTVTTTSSQTIDGASTYALAAQWSTVTVQSNGSNWVILSKI